MYRHEFLTSELSGLFHASAALSSEGEPSLWTGWDARLTPSQSGRFGAQATLLPLFIIEHSLLGRPCSNLVTEPT